MTMNTNQKQEIQTTNFAPRSSVHPKKQIKLDTKKVVKVVGGVGAVSAVTLAGAISYNVLTNNDSAMAVEKTEEPKTTLVSSANVNNINGKKVVKEAVEKETITVVESKKAETTKSSQKGEIKPEVVKATPKVETAAVVNTTTETEVKEVKPSVEESKPVTEEVVEEEVNEKNEVVEEAPVVQEAPVVEETEKVESQVETPAEDVIVEAEVEIEEEVSEEENEELEDMVISETRATYVGLADSGCIEVEVDGVTQNFYFYGNENILATVENLPAGAEILVQYTTGNQAVEVLALEEARPAVEMTITNFCTPMSIEVIENGFAKVYPLLDDQIRGQINHLGANAFVSIVVKNGIEYVKLVEYVTSFAEGTFISSDAETATISVGGEMISYKLAEELQGKDLAWEIGVGSFVNFEIVETNEGSFIERIN